MLRALVASVVAIVVLTVVLGFGYPGADDRLRPGRVPDQANGSLIERDGKVVGSSLAAQEFSSPGYFHERPSATSPAYNAAFTTFSNLGPTNPALAKLVKQNAARDPEARAALQPGPHDPRDPGRRGRAVRLRDRPGHLARVREPAVAPRRRRSPPAARDRAAADQAEHRRRARSAFLGEPGVNVLELNLALDKQVRADGPPLVAERLLARARPRGDPGLVPEARPAAAAEEPGDVHRRARQRDHDRDLLQGPRAGERQPALVRRRDRDLALADRPLRELRRGDRRRPRQGAGQRAARDPDDDDGASPLARRAPRGDRRARAAEGRHRGRRGGDDHPRRRRRSSRAPARSTSRRSPASPRP